MIDRKKVDIHIQKIVPNPPKWMDRAIPAREPTPIFDDRAIIRVSFGVIFVEFVVFFRLFRIFNSLNWGNFSFIVYSVFN